MSYKTIACLFLILGGLAFFSLSSYAASDDIESAASSVPQQYRQGVIDGLKAFGGRAPRFISFLRSLPAPRKEGMAFLLSHMPPRDFKDVPEILFKDNLKLAYRVMDEVPWGKSIPKDIFLNDVLPYASITEARDNWRPVLYRRFMPVVRTCKTIREAVAKINRNDLGFLRVRYDIDKRPRPDQSPFETMSVRYASCTGLSILLVDILRAVGIPARVAAIQKWSADGGNHTWVEVWDNGVWHFIGAGEAGEYDHTWFNDQAAKVDGATPAQTIYAVSFRKTGHVMPMAWNDEVHDVFADDVTGRYKKKQ